MYEADAWFSLIRRLKYTKVVLIYSQEEEGRMVASRFQMLTEDSDIQVGQLRAIGMIDRFSPHLIRSNAWKNMNRMLISRH